MKIALFGGSFDPPHHGHDAIVKKALKNLDIDKLIIMPTFLNPFKNSFIANEHQRIIWIKKLWESLEKVEISDFEINQKRPVPSIESVEYLISLYNPSKFYLLIGADHLKNLSSWHNFNELNKKVEFIIANRDNIKIPSKFNQLNTKVNISSSIIRKTLDTNYINDKIKNEVKNFYTQIKKN